MEPQINSFSDVLSNSWRLFSQGFKALWPVLTLLFIGISVLMDIPRYFPADPVIFGICMTIISLVIIFARPFTFLYLNGLFHSEPNLSRKQVMKRVLERYISYVLLTVIMAILIAGGLTLFIIPGVVIVIFLIFSLQVLYIENTSIRKALKGSFNLSKTKFISTLGMLGYIAIGAAGIFTLVVLPASILGVIIFSKNIAHSAAHSPTSMVFFYVIQVIEAMCIALIYVWSESILLMQYYRLKQRIAKKAITSNMTDESK